MRVNRARYNSKEAKILSAVLRKKSADLAKKIDQVEKKFYEIQEKRMNESSAFAEEIHHKKCHFECCGSHEDFVDFTKCPICGMTEEIQDLHNDQVWALIDEKEANSIYPIIENKLSEWLRAQK